MRIAPSKTAARWLTVSFLSALYAAGAWISWDRWTDPSVDVGRQVYVAWRLSEGDVLYADLAHIFGPMAAYINASVAVLAGASIRSLAMTGLVVIAATAALLYRLLTAIGGPRAGLAASASFLLLCAFPQYIFQANFNFVTPYSTELTYSLLSALASLLLCLPGFGARKSRSFLAGVFAAFAFLGKPEVFAALIAALLVARIPILGQRAPRGVPSLWALAAGGLLILGGVWTAFFDRLGPAGALAAVAGAFVPLITPALREDPYYFWVSGLDAPAAHIGLALAGLVPVASFWLAGQTLGRFSRGWTNPIGVLAVVAMVSGASVALLDQDALIRNALRPLPILVALLGVAYCIRAFSPATREGRMRARSWAMVSVFALVLLGKILLAARLFHYGFALAMPAVALLAAWLCAHPRRALGIRATGWSGPLLAGLACAIALAHAQSSIAHYALREFPLGVGSNAMRVFDPVRDPRVPRVAAFTEWARLHIPAGATLLVLPDSAMLNVLSGHEAGTPFYALPAPELRFHGEAAILGDLQRSPPDYVALVDQPVSLFPAFGTQGNGRTVLDWIVDTYEPVALFGAPPFQGMGGGIGVMRHRAAGGLDHQH